jgi:hypothetical protein
MLHCPAVVGLSGKDEIAPTNAIHTYLQSWNHHTTLAATAPAIGATTDRCVSTKQLPALYDTTIADSQASVCTMEVLWWESFCHGRALFHKKSLRDFMKRLEDQAEVFKLNLPQTGTIETGTIVTVTAEVEEYIELQKIEVRSSHGMSLDLHDDIDDDWIDLATSTSTSVTAESVTSETATATAACTPTREDSGISSSSVHDTRAAAAAAVAVVSDDDWQSDNCQDNSCSDKQDYCKCEDAAATGVASAGALCGGSSGDTCCSVTSSSDVVSKQRVHRDRSRSRTRQITVSVSPVRQVVSAQ